METEYYYQSAAEGSNTIFQTIKYSYVFILQESNHNRKICCLWKIESNWIIQIELALYIEIMSFLGYIYYDKK